jgi:GT2 family glycosyltransferase
MTKNPPPNITVVIATHNRRRILLQTLRQLTSLPEQPAIIVVDNASTDGTPNTVHQHFPQVKVLRLSKNIGAAARNVGVQHAVTPYVALSDDDSWWHAASLAQAAELMNAHPQIGVIAAKTLVGEAESLDPICYDMAESPLGTVPGLPGPSVLGFLACAAIVRRQAFLAIGGFEPELLIGGEEELLALDMYQAGWELVYVPEIVAYHYPARGPRPRRQYLQFRNALMVAWIRRSIVGACQKTGHLLRQQWRQAFAWTALISLVWHLPWIVRHRQPLPTDIETLVRSLDSARPKRSWTWAPRLIRTAK